MKKLIATALVLISLGAGGASECFEDETCWDGRTMGNTVTGERWVGHNGADTWTPDRINWYVHVKWVGTRSIDMIHTA